MSSKTREQFYQVMEQAGYGEAVTQARAMDAYILENPI